MELQFTRTAREQSATRSGIVGQNCIALHRGCTTWEGPEELLTSLVDEQGLRLDEWQRTGLLDVVKDGPHRAVYRVELPTGALYLKHYKAAAWTTLVRNSLGHCAAIAEYRNAIRVAEAGVPTVTPVAIGWNRAGMTTGESFLAVRAIEDSQSLHEFVSSPAGQAQLRFRPALRQQLARQLGELTGQLHRAGLLHCDFHPGNILIRVQGPKTLSLWVVDLHAIANRRNIGQSFSERNLSLLHTFFDRFSTQADRFRFFKSYWKALGDRTPVGSAKAAAKRVESCCQIAVQQAYRNGDRKWLRSSRRLVIAEHGPSCWRSLREFGSQIIHDLGDDPDRLFKIGKIHFWRRRTSCERLAAVDLQSETGTRACYIRASMNPRRTSWRRLSKRWSNLRRAWEMGHAFLRRGISTPLPLLHVETKSIAAIQEFLVTERIPGVLPLTNFLEHSLPAVRPTVRENWLIAFTKHLASQIARMHRCDIDHSILAAENILVASNFTASNLWFLGLEAARLRSRESRTHVPSNLATLSNSLAGFPLVRRTHRLRFLKTYLGRRFSVDWKPLWRQVEELARKAKEVPLEGESLARRRAFLAASMGIAAAALTGCRVFRDDRSIVALPSRHSLKSEQLLVLSDFKLPKDHPLIRDLTALRNDVANSLDLALEKDPVVVYLFSNETMYRQYLEAAYPGLPPRRAYFVGTPTELAVYTFWGDNIQEDLRHEYTHGLLHSAIRNVPIWIDEGLAEYFEVADGLPGRVNTDYANRLATALGNGWRPDLKRLERIDEFSKMQQVDYQESWSWVHFMLHSTPEAREALVSYLRDLKTSSRPVALSVRLERDIPGSNTRFLSHLASLPQARQMAKTF